MIFLGEDRSYPVIPCPEVGLVRVSPERLQRGEVNFEVLVKLLAAVFDLIGAPQELKAVSRFVHKPSEAGPS